MVTNKFLTIYAGVLTGALCFVVLTGFTAGERTAKFDTVTAKRINIVEPDGTLRMVISDHAKLPGVIVRGREEKLDRPQAGMLFYNDEGSENGGLIFGGRKNDKGEVTDAGGSLSFDRYGANQIVQLIGVDDKEDKFAGLVVTDSLTGTDTRRRVWAGRTDDGNASLQLMDANGKKRVVIEVKPDGASGIYFFDANGKVVNRMAGADK